MENYFSRVKSIIERLRGVLKCQKCVQMKKEDLMVFFHVCDHFYCVDCLKDEKTCPLCKNSLDKLVSIVDDKNILSLYQSLAKFELPPKHDIEKIFKSCSGATEKKLEKKEEQIMNKKNEVQETPKNRRKSRVLRSTETRKSNLTSPDGADIILLSSNDSNVTPKRESSNSLGRMNKNQRSRRGRNVTTTPNERGRNTTPVTLVRQGTTPLIRSAGSSLGNASFSKSNINKRNPKGETQLHLACKRSNFSLMEELIAAGANPNAQDNAGWTPLHDSVFSGNVEVIKFLLDHGAKVNVPGLENTTALHEAIAKGNKEIVKLLLEYGADVNAMNIFKETPVDLVTKYKLEEMKEILSECSTTAKKTSQQAEEPEKFLLHKYNLSIEDEKMVNKFVDKFQGEIIPSLTLKTSPSHVIISDAKVEISWVLISSVPKGCWVVTTDWVKDSLKENTPKPAANYEPSSPSFSGFPKARFNTQNQLPGLFSGCHFFFGGNFDYYAIKKLTIKKEDLKNLVEKNGGVILKRCPDPESLALEKTIPFHSPATSSLRETSYFIIYQTEKWDPKPKYNMSHMKTLPVEWLVCCVMKFELIDPAEVSWNKFL